MKVINETLTAIKKLFSKPFYLWLSIIFIILTGLLYILVPVYTIPGNDLNFWLTITPWWGYILLFLFSLATGVLLSMQVYIFSHHRSIKERSSGVLSLFSVIVGGLYATAACVACINTLFAFLGASGTIFLSTNRDILMPVTLVITGLALFYNSKKINGNCETCKIETLKVKY